jgi:hypothetical protein
VEKDLFVTTSYLMLIFIISTEKTVLSIYSCSSNKQTLNTGSLTCHDWGEQKKEDISNLCLSHNCSNLNTPTPTTTHNDIGPIKN